MNPLFQISLSLLTLLGFTACGVKAGNPFVSRPIANPGPTEDGAREVVVGVESSQVEALHLSVKGVGFADEKGQLKSADLSIKEQWSIDANNPLQSLKLKLPPSGQNTVLLLDPDGKNQIKLRSATTALPIQLSPLSQGSEYVGLVLNQPAFGVSEGSSPLYVALSDADFVNCFAKPSDSSTEKCTLTGSASFFETEEAARQNARERATTTTEGQSEPVQPSTLGEIPQSSPATNSESSAANTILPPATSISVDGPSGSDTEETGSAESTSDSEQSGDEKDPPSNDPED